MRTTFPMLVLAALAVAACSDSPSRVAAPAHSPAGAVTASSPEPASGDNVLWQDSFDSYKTVKGNRPGSITRNYSKAGAISLVTGRNGGQAVRFAYSAASTYNVLEKGLAGTADGYFRFWYRLSPGADPTNAGTSAWGMTWLYAMRNSGRNYSIGAGDAGAGPAAALPAPHLSFNVHDASSTAEPDPFVQNVDQTTSFGTTNDGNWHEFTAHIVTGTGGYEQAWVDGVLVLNSNGFGYDHAPDAITTLRLLGDIAQAPTSSFTVDIDDLAIWESGSGPTTQTVATVVVAPSSTSVQPGQTAQLTATAYDASGNPITGQAVTWASSNTSVATVSSSGLVTGVAAGSATITATVSGISGQSAVTVATTTATVATVAVTLGASSLTVGQTTQATATARDASGNVITGRTVTWSSSAPTVASVSGSGLVSALAAGSTNIVATIDGVTGSSPLSVAAPQPASVTVSPSSAAINVGQTTQLSATVRDASGNTLSGYTVTWSSSNGGVATVSSSGLVTGVAAGSATIRATAGTVSGSSAVTVSTSTTTSGGSPEPAVGNTILWQDNFDSGSLTSYAKRGVQQIVGGRTGSAVRFPYTGSSYDNLIEYGFTTTTDIYFRYWYRLSPGADPTCGGQGGSGMKWFMAWRPNTLPRYTMGVGLLGNNNAGNEFTSHDNSSSAMPNPFLQNISKTPRFGTTNDGNWHEYTLHIVTGTGGYEQIWVDGIRVLDDSGYNYDHDATGINLVQMPGTVVQWFSGCDFTIDIDDLVVWHK